MSMTLQPPSHQNSNELSAKSPLTTNGALAFLIMDHDPRMVADVAVNGLVDDGVSSRQRDDTLVVKSTFLPLSTRSGPGPRTAYEG